MDFITLSIYVAIALFIAGAVKGAVGLGLPTTALGLLTLAIDARTAIALVIIPMLVSNIWQFYRAGDMRRAAIQYAPFAVVLAIGVGLVFMFTKSASDQAIYAGLGIILLLYVGVTVLNWRLQISDGNDRIAQVIAGASAGVMGGIAGVWAPSVVVYLAARNVSKAEFVRATGLLLMVGSAPLLVGYVREGFLHGTLFWMSVCLLVPTFAGFSVGESFRNRLSETGFRRLLMIIFALMGLNLLRRAMF